MTPPTDKEPTLPSVCLLLISDGREEYLERTLASAAEMLPPLDFMVHVDDTDHELGFGGAIRAGWEMVLATDADYVFHLEQDFTFNQPPPIDDMVRTLECKSKLAQLALLRQPWNAEEREAGSLTRAVGRQSDLVGLPWGSYMAHRWFFTTNPSLYPRWVVERGWPDCLASEGNFGLDLFASDPHIECGFWGAGEEWVTHIGDDRAGTGY